MSKTQLILLTLLLGSAVAWPAAAASVPGTFPMLSGHASQAPAGKTASADLAESSDGKATYFTIDPEGSVETLPYGINQAGDVAGNYYDAGGISHGFLRTSDGTITTFDPQGSTDTEVGASECINDDDAIVGSYADASGVYHGYVRAADGTIATFDPSGSIETDAFGINNEGVVGGDYYDSTGTAHGFLRSSKGQYKTFDADGAVYTSVGGINETKAAGGEYQDSSGAFHGLVRSPKGKIETFDVKGSISTGAGDSHLTSDGALVGGYYREGSGYNHPFIRTGDGKIETFDPPHDLAAVAFDINNSHVVSGYYLTKNKILLGFVRAADGTFTKYRVPQAGKQQGAGTISLAINDQGWIAGQYMDSAGVIHGYLRTPK